PPSPEPAVRPPRPVDAGVIDGKRQHLVRPRRSELPGPEFGARAVVLADECVIRLARRLPRKGVLGAPPRVHTLVLARGRVGEVVPLSPDLAGPLDETGLVDRATMHARC